MSAIFGFIRLDSRPASKDDLRAMASVPAFSGADAVTFRICGPAAFGHALVAVSPESRYEAMPSYDRASGTLLTAAARLDNRDDLLDHFKIPVAEGGLVPDSRLVRLCFAKWGEAAPRHLYGDWSFAAWSEDARRLFLARDRVGITGLYVYHGPRLAVFSSSLASLLAHPDAPCDLDELAVARYLINPHRLRYQRSFLDRALFQTVWQGVYLLAPGHMLCVASQGVFPTRYWRPEDAPRIRLGSRQAYLDGFLDHYRRAVGVRLRAIGPLASTLSAGLDSGSVTALAAQALHSQDCGLTAFTSVPMFECERFAPGRVVDEWPLAHRVAQRFKNVIHIRVRAEHASITDSLVQSVALLKQATHAVSNMYWIFALLQEARNRGARVLLTGQMGNGTVSWAGAQRGVPRLLLRSRRWLASAPRRLLQARTVFSRQNILFPGREAKSDHVDLYARRLQGPVQDWLAENSGLLSSGANTDTPETQRVVIFLLSAIIGGPFWHTVGTAFGLEVRDPTADVRLLEYCLGIPGELFRTFWGERMLIRRAMHGILPEEVRIGTRRGKQAADVPLRLLAQHDEVERILKSLDGDSLVRGIIDCGTLRAAWKGMRQNGASVRTLEVGAECLLRGVAAGSLVKQVFCPTPIPVKDDRRMGFCGSAQVKRFKFFIDSPQDDNLS